MADILPGYSFDTRVARYRSSESGRYVARRDIAGLLDAQVNSAETRLGDIVTALHEGRLSASTYQSTMRDELRRLHLQNAALGAGGFEQLGPREFGRTGGLLRDDYQRLTHLADGVANGEVTLPQALNRVRGYIGNARINFWEADRDAARMAGNSSGMASLMIRDLGASEHCSSCTDYHSQGWQYDLPVPGTQSECGSHCRCSARYRQVAFNEADDLIGTRR